MASSWSWTRPWPYPILLLILASTLFHATPTSAANNVNGVFATPPDAGPLDDYANNVVYQLGTTLQLQWATGMSEYRLKLWQQLLNESNAYPSQIEIMSKGDSTAESNGASWYVQTYELDIDLSNIFFLSISTDGRLSNGFTSHYFNLSRDAVPSSTVGASSLVDPTSSPNSSASKDTKSSSSSSSSSSDSSSKDDNALKIALSVGLGVGIPLVALCAFVAGFLLFRKQKKQRLHHANENGADIVTRHIIVNGKHSGGGSGSGRSGEYPWTGSSHGSGSARFPAELSPTGRRPELHQTPKPPSTAELDGRSKPTELDCVAGEG